MGAENKKWVREGWQTFVSRSCVALMFPRPLSKSWALTIFPQGSEELELQAFANAPGKCDI